MRRLLIRPGGIGDCLLCFPAMQFLRSAYTEVWISTPVVPLVQFADAVCSVAATGLDAVGIGDRPMDERLRERLAGFDEVVSWYGSNRPEFRTALEAAGVRCVFYPALPPAEGHGHACDFFSSQVGAPAGQNPSLAMERTVERRNAVVIHPFSGGRKKNWQLSKFRELAGRLPWTVDWTAGPEEELPEARRFESLRELAHWLSGARLYIGNDSGITHLAAAAGVRTVAILGASDPAVWAPRGGNVKVVASSSLEDVSVGDVLKECTIDAWN